MIRRQPIEHNLTDLKGLSPGLPTVIWRRRWVVLGCVSVAIGFAILYLALARPIYTSTASIYIEQGGPRIVKEDQPALMAASNNYLYNQIELIKSTPVLSKAIEICQASGLLSISDPNEAIEYIRSHLEVTAGRKDDIVRICIAGPNSIKNATVANAVVQSYLAFHADHKARTYGEILKVLKKEKAAKERTLSDYMQALEDLTDRHPQLAIHSEIGKVLLDRFEGITSALTEATLAALDARSFYEAAERIKDDTEGLLMMLESRTPGGLQAPAQQEMTRLKAHLEQLQLDRSERLRLVTTEHPTIKAIDTEIAQVSDQLQLIEERLVSRAISILRQQYLAAQQRKDVLSSRLDQQYQQIAQFNKVIAQYTQIQSQYQQEKMLCELLDQRIDELSMIADAGVLNITVIEDARPATKPSKPTPVKVIAISIILGIATGCCLAVLLQATDNRLADPRLIRALVPYPVLGEVPVISNRHSGQTQQVMEVFRTIRNAVLLGIPEDQSHIIQVASAIPQEGTSTAVSYLATAMANMGQRTLIVDANLHHPSQHQIFGLDGRVGLSSVLTRKAQLADAILRTAIPGLYIMPAGPNGPRHKELLYGKTFGQVLMALARYFDRIVIDSPPFATKADAQMIAAVSQSIIFVLRPGLCTYQALGLTEDHLARYSNKPVAVIINAVAMGRRQGWSTIGSRNGRTRPNLLARASIRQHTTRSHQLSGYTRIKS